MNCSPQPQTSPEQSLAPAVGVEMAAGSKAINKSANARKSFIFFMFNSPFQGERNVKLERHADFPLTRKREAES
jgi:hypothetical protein